MYQNIFVTNRTYDEPSVVYVWDDVTGLTTYPFSKFDYAYKKDPHGQIKTIYGDSVTKTRRWQREDPNICESDVPRETRVLTDLYLDSDEVSKNHKILFFDIEVDSVSGFSEPQDADNEITAIGMFLGDRYRILALDPDHVLHETDILTPFDNERELLVAFLEVYSTYAPTILTGWNIAFYDIPYLINRIAKVIGDGTELLLSPIGKIRFSEHRQQYQIAGVSVLDYQQLYKKFTYTVRPSYALNAIGLYELGMGKIQYDGSLDTLRRTDIQKFIDYNVRDVEIVVKLDEKMKLISLVQMVAHVSHTQYEDFMYSSKFIEGTILTYLHRKQIVAPNKPLTGALDMQTRSESHEDGFEGAYVKPPNPGLYNNVFSLDLQSLYPSIIMSLNISPETKAGRIDNWDSLELTKPTQHTYNVHYKTQPHRLTPIELQQFVIEHGLTISSNGILYETAKQGVIPEILSAWFSNRLEFKRLMKDATKQNNTELAEFYDRRQHVQKILLNSVYGSLGLPVFRFYDLDNALAVTSTSQTVIKTSAKYVNSIYKKRGATPKTESEIHRYGIALDKVKDLSDEDRIELLDPHNHCIYIDTDSLYFSTSPLETYSNTIYTTLDIVATATQIESQLNAFYDVMTRRLFNCSTHRLLIKGESVCETAFWVVKKRYGLWKTYDLDAKIELSEPKLSIKGLDIVRSSFPKAFSKFMQECLIDILKKTPKSDVDSRVLTFRSLLTTLPFEEVARNTSVNNITSLDDKRVVNFETFPKGASAHVKAAISYNRWLRIHKLDKLHTPVRDGDKIKWIYLKPNPLHIPTMALKGEGDPLELVQYVAEYMDYDVTFKRELSNKLQDFYDALGWGVIPTETNHIMANFLERLH